MSGTRDVRVLRREARLHQAGIMAAPDGDLRVWWAELAEIGGPPIAVIASQDEGSVVRAVMHVEPAIVRLAVPDVATRVRLWGASTVGPRLDPHEAAVIAARFPFTPGTIARAAARAADEP